MSVASAGGSRRRGRGAILVGVLWIMVFLAALAVVLRLQMSSVLASVRVTEDKAAARIIAEAGLARGAALVLSAPQRGPGSLDDRMQGSVETGSGTITVDMLNEALRIDLNTAEQPLLVGMFRAAGAAPDLAGQLADRLVARRGKSGNGEEGATPPGQSAGDGQPLQSVDEATYLEGMPQSVALGIAAYATVSSGLKGARLEMMDEKLLAAIPGFPPTALTAIRRYRKGDIGRDAMDAALAGVEYNTSDRAEGWRAQIRVDLENGHTEAHEALIMISPEDDAPYRVLDWRSLPVVEPRT